MVMTAVATAQLGYLNTIAISGAPPAGTVTSWQVVAHTTAGDYTVRGAPVYTDATHAAITDYYPPLSSGATTPWLVRPITYSVRAFTTTGTQQADTAAVYAWAGDVALLTDSEHPSNTVQVTVESQDPADWTARSVYYDVLDRADSVVAMQPARMRHGSLTLLTQTIDQRTALRELLRGGAPVLLRTTQPARVDDLMLLPVDWTMTERIPLDGSRRFVVDYQAVAADLGPYPTPPDRTYVTLLTDGRVPTYADLAGNGVYDNYTQVLDGVPA
jgi:hypothetical protein